MLPVCALVATLAVGAAAGQTAPDHRQTLTPERAERVAKRVTAGRDLTPDAWPHGKRVAVALTFDLDAELVWMDDPERASPGQLSRGAYGPRAGLPRILRLLEARAAPATFFMPALVLRLHPEAVAAIRRSGRHEIGYHGWAHESVLRLSEAQEREAMRRGLELFAQAGLRPTSYRSPSWDFGAATLGLLRELGFTADSSLMGDDRPYEILDAGEPSGIVELPVDWSLDDWPYFQLEWEAPLPVRAPGDVLEIWRSEFDALRAEGGVFVLTLHPQVIGRAHRMRLLEQLLDHIDATGEAWYATLGSVASAAREASRASEPVR